MNRFTVSALSVLSVLATGCASITGSELQQVSLSVQQSDQAVVEGARCKLANDKGSWEATAPGFVQIRRSADDLTVKCEKQGLPDGLLKAVSRAGGDMYGNIIFGGGIGALIDHNKGNGYNYPDELLVLMGASRVVDRREQDNRKNAEKGAAATTDRSRQ